MLLLFLFLVANLECVSDDNKDVNEPLFIVVSWAYSNLFNFSNSEIEETDSCEFERRKIMALKKI